MKFKWDEKADMNFLQCVSSTNDFQLERSKTGRMRDEDRLGLKSMPRLGLKTMANCSNCSLILTKSMHH